MRTSEKVNAIKGEIFIYMLTRLDINAIEYIKDDEERFLLKHENIKMRWQ